MKNEMYKVGDMNRGKRGEVDMETLTITAFQFGVGV